MNLQLLDTLRHDHELVQEILEKLVSTGDNAIKTRQQQWDKLAKNLLPHMMAEEKLIYPVLRDGAEDKEHRLEVLEATQEHRVARMLMADIMHTEPDNEHWKAKMMVLQELIEHHIQEEEEDLFELAEKVLDEEQDRKMTQEFKQTKKTIDPDEALRHT